MQDDQPTRRSDFRWGIPVSVVAHLLVAIVLILGLPLELPKPQEEETVTVEIVEPPPEPEPEPEPEQEPEPEPEPEPEQAEQEPAGEPPPPAPEEAPAPEPPAEQEPSADETAEAPPVPVLRPVVEFGEATTGPRVSLDGNSSEAGAKAPPEGEVEPAPTAEPDTPEEIAAAAREDDAIAALMAVPPQAIVDASEAAEQAAEVLPEATRLFSPDLTKDPVARTAIDGTPRAMRATQLCETELTEQLRNATPPRDPDFIPRSPLSEGTVLELPRTAFRHQGAWYELSFRCEINEEATRVMSFAFRVGAPVPRSEWRRRGFPGS